MSGAAALPWVGGHIGYKGVGIGMRGCRQHQIPPTHVALLFALQPLFAALAGWAFQDDRLAPLQWIGGALIVTGVIIASRDRA